MMEMRDLVQHRDPEIRKQWIKAVSHEYGRLMKGIGKKLEGKNRVEGHDTIRPIYKIQSQRIKQQRTPDSVVMTEYKKQKEEDAESQQVETY